MRQPSVTIAVADAVLRQSLRRALLRIGCDVAEASDRTALSASVDHVAPNLVIMAPPSREGRAWLETVADIRRVGSDVAVIFVAAESTEELAIGALKAGVADYFRYPISLEDLTNSARHCLAGHARGRSRPPDATSLDHDGTLIGDSAAMCEIRAYIGRVAATNSHVLITGETGTGKELAADLIHRQSARADRPLVSINCAAIPEGLLESELFGYERGAFTGATGLKEGALKLADGGSVFLDEIGDMSLPGQAKILRVLEARELLRLGGRRSVRFDVRVITATNQDLEAMIGEGKFRRDLYFRLNVARIHLPPLRDRREDIPRLCDHYIRQLNRQCGREVEGLTSEAMDSLLAHDWPGNVRELKNLLEAIFINLPSRRIALVDLPGPFRQRLTETQDLPQDERARLLSALFATNWNKSLAARKLRWSRMTVYRKLAKYQLQRGGEPRSSDSRPAPDGAPRLRDNSARG